MKLQWILATAQEPTNSNGQGPLITMEEAAPATTTTTQENGAAPQPGDPEQQEYQPNPLIWIMFLILGVYIFLIMFRGPRKKQQEHRKMVSSLRKNDRVRTIGGIFGTVLEVRDDEIVLKIDEATNTKLRVIPSAIATVLSNNKTD